MDPKEGAELNNSIYTNHSRQRLYGSHSGTLSIYETSLNIFGWGAFFSSDYTTADKRLALSAGIRMDGNTYNRKMRQLWKQFSPRLSASYKLSEQWTLSGSTGLYHQLPPYTALGYKDNEGQYLNKDLKYMQVFESSLGLDWHLQDRFMVLQKVSSSVTAVCHFPSKTTFRWHAKETITVSPATKHSSLQPAAGPTDWKPCSAGRHPASSISYPPSPYTAANTATVQMETSFHLPGTTVSYST